MRSTRWYLLFVVIALLSPHLTIRAQQSGSDWYKGFRYDSLFRVGADDASLADQAFLKDSLHFDFVRTYGGPSRITDSLLVSPPTDATDTAWINFVPGERDRWLSRHHVQRYRELAERGLQVVYAFKEVCRLQNSADAVEASAHAKCADESSLQR